MADLQSNIFPTLAVCIPPTHHHLSQLQPQLTIHNNWDIPLLSHIWMDRAHSICSSPYAIRSHLQMGQPALKIGWPIYKRNYFAYQPADLSSLSDISRWPIFKEYLRMVRKLWQIGSCAHAAAVVGVLSFIFVGSMLLFVIGSVRILLL